MSVYLSLCLCQPVVFVVIIHCRRMHVTCIVTNYLPAVCAAAAYFYRVTTILIQQHHQLPAAAAADEGNPVDQ